MVLTDSCCALSMNEQVLTPITSASSPRRVSSAPERASIPIMTSLSTRFLGQPRLTKPTFCGRVAAGESGLSSRAALELGVLEDMTPSFILASYFRVDRAASNVGSGSCWQRHRDPAMEKQVPRRSLRALRG